MPPEKRNIKSLHPGVWILKSPWKVRGKGADEGKVWQGVAFRGKWKDPDTGRWEWLTLDKANYPSKAARILWARDKSDTIHKRLAELRAGSSRAERVSLVAAIEEFLASCRAQKRPRTVQGYAMSLGFLGRWAGRVGLRTAADLTPTTLARFAEAVKSGDALRPKRKTKRSPGKGRPPSPVYCNNTFRAVSTFCRWLRRLRYAPGLHRDLVAEALEPVQAEVALPRPHSATDCRKLLQAALRHDAATFKITRAEHAATPSANEVATTLRHRPVAPFVLFTLLSGCRAGEARTLRWADVDFDTVGEDGSKVGEIRLLASAVKNRKERTLDLAISPGLRSLLVALRVRVGGKPYVFGGDAPLSATVLHRAMHRLVTRYGAPAGTWQRLRQTTSSFLHNAKAIYGGAGDYLAADQLGHSPEVARRRYVGRIKNIPAAATTLEGAMGIEDLVVEVIKRVSGNQVAPGAAAAVAG